ncbi:acyl-CoA dehydrogenase [uncultured Bosea sp.]|uniref:acyl-CoA dehydrogenase family protein n=1 Tax=uncultured Bosea sp. TaxID=211457 RepID=UPI0025D2F0DC|nr:acyl-CoA dehydrogenase [uncultured Bosea sp.]
MDFALPEELRQLQEMVRRFVDRELIPIEMEAMDGPDLKPEIRLHLEARARELGLWLLDVPEEHGGMGLGLLGMTVVWQELARTIALPPRGPGIFGPEVRAVLFRLDAAQRARYLDPVLRGEKRTAFAQTEPDAGADPGMIRTRAERQGDGYVINGAKRFISHAERADFLQLVAATEPGLGTRGLSMFLVDMDTPGVSIARRSGTMMGDVTCELVLENVRIPAENLIGKEGEGMRLSQSWLTSGRLYQAARGLGVAQRCLEMATRHARDRVTFGSPLSDRQAIQFMIADMFTEHALGQLNAYRTAWKADQGTLERHESYMVKVSCTELGFKAADRCLQIHGGSGLSLDLPVQKMWRDARSFMITEGATEVMRVALAREIFRSFA